MNITDLTESIDTLGKARLEASSSLTVWKILRNAQMHLETQLAAMLGRPEGK